MREEDNKKNPGRLAHVVPQHSRGGGAGYRPGTEERAGSARRPSRVHPAGPVPAYELPAKA